MPYMPMPCPCGLRVCDAARCSAAARGGGCGKLAQAYVSGVEKVSGCDVVVEVASEYSRWRP